jgi:amino acid permease
MKTDEFSPLVNNSINIIPEDVENVSVLKDGNGNFFSSTLTLVQTSVGAGMLAIPYAFKSMGLIPALVLVIGVAMLSFYTLWMLLKTADAVKEYNLKAIGTKLYGPFMGYFFEFGIFFICFGAAAVYLILIGQSIPPIFVSWFGRKSVLGDRIFLVGILMVVFLLPLCAAKDLSVLSYFSIFSVLSTFFIAGVVVIKFVSTVTSESYSYSTVYLFPKSYGEAFGAFPILVKLKKKILTKKFLSFGAHVTIVIFFYEI